MAHLNRWRGVLTITPHNNCAARPASTDHSRGADDTLLDKFELSKMLRVKIGTLAKWRMDGRGPPFVKLGRCVFYRRSAVEHFIAARERMTTLESGRR